MIPHAGKSDNLYAQPSDAVLRPAISGRLKFIRQGDPQRLDIINNRVQEPPDDAVKLTPTNAAANTINEATLKAIQGQLFTYKASLEGKVPTAPAEEELKLKKGARVVIIANIYQEEDGLVAANGDTGDVVELDDEQSR